MKRQLCARCRLTEAPEGGVLCGPCLGAERRAHYKVREVQTLVSVVFRMRKGLGARLDGLVASTRIRKAELMREAISDLLKKHAGVLQ